MDFFPYGEKEVSHLKRKDAKLGRAIDRIGAIRRPVNGDIFSALVESIVGQQISNKAAATVCARLRLMSGMRPEGLLDPAEVRACGMSARKAGYISGLAGQVACGGIALGGLRLMGDGEVVAALTKIDGIGVWTAEMLLIFCLARPDVVSYGDLAIRRGMMNLYGHKEMTRERFAKYARRYSPYGSVASLYLWELS